MIFKFRIRTLKTLFLFQFLPLLVFSQLLSEKSSYSKYDTLLGTISPLRSYDVLHYDLFMDIDLENKSIKGSSVMKFECTEDMKSLQIDLFARYNILGISLEGQTLSYSRDSNFVFVQFSKPIQKGKIYSIKTTYSGIPLQAKNAPWDGGFIWKKDSFKNHWVGVACEGLGASSWWPCKDHWSDEPAQGISMHFTVPKPYEVVSNGRLISVSNLGKKSMFHWEVRNPINLYAVTLNIAQYAHWEANYLSKETGKKLDINYWVLKENEQAARKQFEQVIPMMECFESKFGSYPFYEDGYQLVETPYLGMEHQSCVAYGNKYKNGYLGNLGMTGGHTFDYIIIHETGHEWFGNNITAADNADMWIHEAFTTYSESIYAECMYGQSAGALYLDKMRRRVDNDEPIVGPYGVAKEGSGDMYAKGALFLHTLRCQLNNDKLWYQLLRDINSKFRHKTTHYNDIVQFYNVNTNHNWNALFDTYLKEKDIPELKIFKEEKKGVIVLMLEAPSARILSLDVKYILDGVEKTTTLSTSTVLEIPYKKDFKMIENNYLKYTYTPNLK